MKKIKIIALVLSVLMMFSCKIFTCANVFSETMSVTAKYNLGSFTRQMEKLDRGLTAVKISGGVYLSWRLYDSEDNRFGSSPFNINFKLYKNGTLVDTISDTTNYIDDAGTMQSSYQIASVVNGVEGDKCDSVSPFTTGNNYLEIALSKPADFTYIDASGEAQKISYKAGDVSCGDLNGDGIYELIVKWDASPQDNSNYGITGNVLLDAYKLSGEHIWRIDLGRNIRGGEHYTQFSVYDFDLDGKAEIACKTAPGSKDGCGLYVSQASLNTNILNADNTKSYVNSSGYVLEGDEFYTIFSGLDGAALDTVYYPIPRGNISSWGDSYGNRVDRYLAAVAYLDGINPSMVIVRGYYTRTTVTAFNLVNKRLVQTAQFDSNIYGASYGGQGNHNITVADVDGDGKDEILTGAICFDHDLSVKWCSFRGHGDALHIGDYDPAHPGLEYFSVHESGGGLNNAGVMNNYGFTVYDAKNGTELLHKAAGKDTGRGVMANIGAGGYYQVWAANALGPYMATGNGVFQSASIPSRSYNFRIFWDGDLNDELLNNTSVTNWNGKDTEVVFTANGCVSVNGTKSVPALTADLFGDWREEVVYSLSDYSALRVFTTTDYTNYKLKTLMHDPVYRCGVAAENTAYNQPPHIGFYLNDSEFKPPLLGITVTPPDKRNYNIGEELNLTGLTVTANYAEGISEEKTDYSVWGYDKYKAGEQEITVTYLSKSYKFTVSVSTGFTIDNSGYITGYLLNIKEEILPTSINRVTVIGFRANSLYNTTLEKITVLQEEIIFENNVFNNNITICCFSGSDADIYAKSDGLNAEIISIYTEPLVFVTYDEEEYSDLSMAQSNIGLTQTVGDITYKVNGRSSGGDNTTGFRVVNDNNNKYLLARAARFSTGSRIPYFTIANIPENTPNIILSMDLYFETYNGRYSKMIINNSDSDIDTVTYSMAGGAEVWCNYNLSYNDSVYTRTIKDTTGKLISKTVLGQKNGDFFAGKISVTQDSGSYSSNSNYAAIRIDNLKIMIPDMSNLTLNLKDKNGRPVENATVSYNEDTLKTKADGKASFKVEAGRYLVNIISDKYKTVSKYVSAMDAFLEKDIVLEEKDIAVSDIAFVRNEVKLTPGMLTRLYINILPENTNESYYLTVGNENIAEIIDNKYVLARQTGETIITAATKSGLTAQCVLNVISKNYSPSADSILIVSGADTVYKSSFDDIKSSEYRAIVLDRNGVEMYDQTINWSVNANSNITVTSINNDTAYLTVSKSAPVGNISLSASSGGKTIIKTINVSDNKENQSTIVKTDFSGSEFSTVSLLQGNAGKSVIVSDITFGVGARSNGGDNKTGIKVTAVDNMKVAADSAGQYNTSGRNAYMIFNTAPVFTTEKDCVFEMDIKYPADYAYEITTQISDGSNQIVKITPSGKNLERDKWYHYALVHKNGFFYEYITDKITLKTSVRSFENPTKATKFARIDFTTTDSASSKIDYVYITNVNLYESENSLSALKIRVNDKNSSYLQEANISVGGISAVTDNLGSYDINLLNGIYNIKVSKDGKSAEKTVVLSGGETIVNISIDYSGIITAKDIVYVSGISYIETYSDYEKNSTMIFANYDKLGRLQGLSAKSFSFNKGEQLRAIETVNNSKVFIWDSFDNIQPILIK